MRSLDNPSPQQGISVSRSILNRLKGPGGFYNLGNAIALTSGIAVQVANAPAAEDLLANVVEYLAGDGGAIWLTISMLLFFVSGEIYHRAWDGRATPDDKLNRLGDLLSGFGAIALTMALVNFGDMALAIVAGTLLAGGKFGTAFLPNFPVSRTRKRAVDDWLRGAVVASRLPSLAALGLELLRIAGGPGPVSAAILPAIMIFCFILWFWADVLLWRGSPTQKAPAGTTPFDAKRNPERQR